MPQDLQDTLSTLYRVLAAVESGEMEPARASAIAAVSRAIVGVYDAGLVEAKLTELEEDPGAGSMKASTRKRLQTLEQAASMHETRQLVILDVRTFSDVDREAYRAGDEGVLRRYGAPDPGEVPSGQIHTVVIDLHPDMRGPQVASVDLQDEDFGE